MQETYRVKSVYLSRIDERFTTIAKRAKRLGCAAPAYEVVSIEDIPVKDDSGKITGEIDRFYNLAIVGEAPVLAGWRFLGVIEHNPEMGVIIRAVPGESIPVQYRSATADNCDHCHKRITTRKETFIVRHESGETKQIGRSCLQDFLGGNDGRSIIAYLELLSNGVSILAAAMDEEEFYGSERGSEKWYDLNFVLNLTYGSIQKYGWISKSQAVDGFKMSTADSVLFVLGSRDSKKDVEALVSEKGAEIASKAIEWAIEQEFSDSDYLYNLSKIAKQGACQWHHFGLACSIIMAYEKAVAEKIRVETSQSTHFGEVGKRQEFILRVLRLTITEGFYGNKYIYSFQDVNGNNATWFGSTPGQYLHSKYGMMVSMEQGRIYRVKATVKEHGEYRGEKQTVLSRLEVQADLTDIPETEWVIAEPKAKKSRGKKLLSFA